MNVLKTQTDVLRPVQTLMVAMNALAPLATGWQMIAWDVMVREIHGCS